jgi:chemotaxis protein histidine kinase CheA
MIGFAEFKKKLTSGGYENTTGARRAVGKVKTWSPEEKEKAHKLINKHFDVTDVPAKKAPAKKAKAAKARPVNPAAKKVRKKKAPVKKAGPKPAKPVAEKPTPAKKTAKKAAAKKAAAKPAKAPKPRAVKDVEKPADPIDTYNRQAAEGFHNYKEGIALLQQVKELSPGTDVSKTAEQAKEGITRLVEGMLKNVVEPLSPENQEVQRSIRERFEQAAPGNGAAATPAIAAPPLPTVPTGGV